MIVYEVGWSSDYTGWCRSWHGTKKEAKAAAKEHSDESPTIQRHVIPNKKESFLFWLNANFDTDNG